MNSIYIVKINSKYFNRLFRKERSKFMNIPAYYVFNDEEMNNLLSIMPKTIDELRKRKILSDIKIKCHGKEIIRILNKK